MHFSASSQWSKICFGYQGFIFNGKKVLKFSQIEAVSLTAFSQFFFDDFPYLLCSLLLLLFWFWHNFSSGFDQMFDLHFWDVPLGLEFWFVLLDFSFWFCQHTVGRNMLHWTTAVDIYVIILSLSFYVLGAVLIIFISRAIFNDLIVVVRACYRSTYIF